MLLTLRRLLDGWHVLVPPAWRPALLACRVRHGGTAVAMDRMRQRRTRTNRGTSFMDVLVGIAITGITLGIALPQIPQMLEPYRLSSAARVIASQLSLARMKSIAQNRRHRVNFDAGVGTYAVEVESAPNTWAAAGGTHELPESCGFSTVATDPTFDTRGMLAQEFEVSVSGAAQSQVVSVNILGNVTVHHPYANDPS
jgi:hypothetical protein